MKPHPARIVSAFVLAVLVAGAVAVAPASASPKGATGLHVVPSPFIAGSSLSAAAVIAPGDMWAVGTIGSGPFQTLAEHFNGTSWSVVPTPALNASLAGVAGAAGNDVWAVGDQAQRSSVNTLIEHWDGTSWSVTPSPNPNPQGNNSLGAVAAISATDIWAAGLQLKGPFTEHWDGASWSIVATPSGVRSIAGMAASSAGTVLAVGQGTDGSGIILSN
jgi:hypothetical protein